MFKKALSVSLVLAAALGFGQEKYALQTHTVHAGIVLISSDFNSTSLQLNNWTPFAWYNLDQDQGVKPSGWTFDNPNHPSTLTGPEAVRWNAISGAAAGQQLNKALAPYWEVPLATTSDQALQNYDVLLLSAHGRIELTPLEREKLHKFMDRGGILWVDLNGGSSLTDSNNLPDRVNGMPLPFDFAPSATTYLKSYLSPLLNFPNTLGLGDITNMAGPNPKITGGVLSGIEAINQAGTPLTASGENNIIADSYRMNTVYGALTPYMTDAVIAEGQVGDGFEIVTTNDAATNLGNGQANTFLASSPAFNPFVQSAAEFAVNVCEMSSQYAQYGKGARKAGSSSAEIGAPLISHFNDARAYTASQSYGYNPPVAYKNLVVITDANHVYVYDAYPAESLSGSGNPDDGLPDFGNGTNYDEVWQSAAMPNAISSAICIEVPTASGSGTDGHPIMEDQIWVEDAAGNLYEWNAFGHFSDGTEGAEPPDHTVLPPAAASINPSSLAAGPYAPTFQDGLLFASDVMGTTGSWSGRVWLVDPTVPTQFLQDKRNNPWMMGGEGNGVLTEISGPSTVGYIPINDNSGGVDRVVYMPVQPTQTPSQSAGFNSLWFGVKGENPSSFTVSGGTMVITPRCAGQSLAPFDYASNGVGLPNSNALAALAIRISLIDANGNPASESVIASTFGTITVDPSNNINAQINNNAWLAANPGYGVRVDYTVDWGGGTPTSTTSQVLRGQLFLVDTPTNSRWIQGSIAMGPTGILYMVNSNPTSGGPNGGSYYEIQEQGRGNFIVLDRWDLFDQHVETITGEPSTTVAPTVENLDPLIGLEPAGVLGNATTPNLLQNLTFISGPTIANGVAYVAAQGNNGGAVQDTVLLAFNAQPPPVTLNLSSFTSNGGSLLQYDMDENSDRSTPTNEAVLQPGQYSFVANSDGTGGRLDLSSMSTVNRGALTNCFSTSQPLIIRQTGSPDQIFYPDSANSKWSPLLWYTVLTGSGTTGGVAVGPPFVSGDTVYVPTSNSLESLLSPPYTPTPVGMVFGISTVISPSDPFLVSDPVHPWQSQLVELNGGSNPISLNNIVPNPDFQWPQFTGVTSVSQYQTRLTQAALKASSAVSSTVAYGAVGGNGKLFAWSDAGLFGFERATIFVADSNRVAAFDSDGNPLWSTDQSNNAGNNGLVGKFKPLVTPNRAYALSNNQVLVVDPGGNRLAILDQFGNEQRAIENFAVDPGAVPDGFTMGESTSFLGPRDVAPYVTVVTAANNHFTNPAPTGPEVWVHYLVADSGNNRLVDIVDRYVYEAATDGPGPLITQGVLDWHSPAAVSGAKFSYTCVTRTYVPSLTTPGYVIAAGIGNPSVKSLTQDIQTGTTVSGGIVLFPPTGSPVLISSIGLGSIGANTLFVPVSPSTSDLTGGFTGQSPATEHIIGDINSLTAKYFAPTGGNPELTLMFTDSTGAYEITEGQVGAFTSNGFAVDWMLPGSLPLSVPAGSPPPATLSASEAPVYGVMRRDPASDAPTTDNPFGFMPTYAERIPNGDIIVVNGYNGRHRKASSGDPNVPFTGEVLELDPTTFSLTSENLGFGSNTIKIELQTLTGVRSIIQPLFADRR
jgi:hypothetical protein